MAIAYDTKSTASVNPASSLTWAHTCTGSNAILFVAADNNSSSLNYITGITYNGVALTKINEIQVPAASDVTSLWYLLNPASGAHNIVITATGSVALLGVGVSYTGVAQTQPNIISGSTTNSGIAVTSLTTSVTTTINNSWALLWSGNNVGVPTAGANATLLQGPFGWNGSCGLFYNTNPISPAGSFSMTYSMSLSNTAAVMAYFEPVVGGIPQILIF